MGRSCILVSIAGKNVMLDCGMHMGFNDDVSPLGGSLGAGRPPSTCSFAKSLDLGLRGVGSGGYSWATVPMHTVGHTGRLTEERELLALKEPVAGHSAQILV